MLCREAFFGDPGPSPLGLSYRLASDPVVCPELLFTFLLGEMEPFEMSTTGLLDSIEKIRILWFFRVITKSFAEFYQEPKCKTGRSHVNIPEDS